MGQYPGEMAVSRTVPSCAILVSLCLTALWCPGAGAGADAGAVGGDWGELLAAAAGGLGQSAPDWGHLASGAWAQAIAAALGSAGHRHSDDPLLEDAAAHFQHSAATHIFTAWLRSLWSQVPKEWAKPVEEIARLFTGEDSTVQVEALFSSLENHTFRKRWIRALSGLAANWIKHLAQPQVQSRYLRQAAITVGGLVEGDLDKELLYPGRPFEDSLSRVVNLLLSRQFGLNVNSATYVKPAVRYVADLVRLGQGSISQMSANEIDDRLAETMNTEVIETVLRVWRAHRYSLENPQCDKYLTCHINDPRNFASSNSTLKPGVTKLASMVSSWFLSGQTGTPFLELYGAATENYNCQMKFPVDCSTFHEEDIRITTDYYHNEL